MNISPFCTDAILLFDEQDRFMSSASVMLYQTGFRRVFGINNRTRIASFMDEAPVSVIVYGLYQPYAGSKAILQGLRQDYPGTRIIVVSEGNDPATAVEYMKLGVSDFLVQPLDVSRLVKSIRNILDAASSRDAVRSGGALINQSGGVQDRPDACAGIITRDRKMLTIFRYMEAIAPTSQAILVTGETGAGKELIARALHEISGRRGDFVSVNVAGLDDIMFSDTLFGHGRGAYTGADRERKGLIEKAAGGTLFFDEMGDLSVASQVKLLRLLQENEYYRLGSDHVNHSSARIIVATNSNLEEKMNSGMFRPDLYYRLCSHHIHLPALRDRRNDIPLLVEHFSRQASQELSRSLLLPSADTLDRLIQYKYPGNVRELKGLIHNAVATSNNGELVVPKLAAHGASAPAAQITANYSALRRTAERMPTLKEAEEYLIKEALRTSGGNQRSAAVMLGISRQALNKRLLRDTHFLKN